MEEITSKMVYRTCIKTVEIVPAFQNLASLYNVSLKEIEKIFIRPRKCTLDSKLREFQFKLLHRIIYTNYHLYRFQFVQDDLCSYCQNFQETYQHLFFECSKIKEMWVNCAQNLKLPILTDLTWKEIHIGIDGGTVEIGQLLNHILILIKFMIFHYRGKSKPPTAIDIQDKLLESRKEERKLAVERNTLTIHLKKWEALEEF